MSRVSEQYRQKKRQEAAGKVNVLITYVRNQPGCTLPVWANAWDMAKAINSGLVRKEGRCPSRFYPVGEEEYGN